jgi:hypothetical protein
MRKIGMTQRPYVWRGFYSNRCQIMEGKGFLDAWRRFFMGHRGDIQTRYSLRKQALPEDSIEQMRAAYRLALPLLETEESKKTNPRHELAKSVLLAAGYSERELQSMALEDQPFESYLNALRDGYTRLIQRAVEAGQSLIEIPHAGAAMPVCIDLRGCRIRASAIYPLGHPVVRFLQKEPEFLPLATGLQKLEVYLNLFLTFQSPL